MVQNSSYFCISSVKDFHDAFYSYCKTIYPAERLFEHYCEGYAVYMQNLAIASSSSANEEDDFIEDEEEDSFSTISSFKSILQQKNVQHFDIEVDDNDTLDTSGINPNVSYNDDHDSGVVSSLFEDHITDDYFQKSSSLSFECYHVAPIFDEYDDGFEIPDLDICDVVQSDQQIHEDIQSIIHEQLEPVPNNYASEGNMEEEDQLVDSHDEIGVVVVQETYELIHDDLDLLNCQRPNDVHVLFLA